MATQHRQRGSIRQRNGVYEVRVYAGLDPLTKKRIYLTETAHDLTAAEKARTRLLSRVDEQRHPKTKITVGRAIDQWMAVARLEDDTRDRYEIAIRMHLRPAFGTVQASKLHPQAVEILYARLARCREQCEGKRKGKADPETGTVHECRPLSNGYLRKLHYILRPALERAYRWDYISSNPMDLVDAPPEDEPEPDPPSDTEVASVLNSAWQRDPDWGTLLFLVAVTGCRRGELCGLRWMNVDLDNGVLFVRRATNRRNKLKKTKTKRIRRIAIDLITAGILRDHLERSQKRAAACKGKITPESYVFSLDPDGSEPLKKNSVTQRYRREAVRHKLRSTRLQSLRDYSVTELIVAGVDLRTVSGRHGHSTGATTLRHYAAWVEVADQRAAEILPARLPRLGDGPLAEGDLAPREKVTAELREAIEDGVMPPGSDFPTLEDLAATYGVSHGTAHRAFAQLKKEGLIEVSRGRRAVVRRPQEDTPDAA
ncbi:tyrosine-type recombinase/integrase [Streptomyces yerevanensis]|uniref:tyrosine-type recombinase/integrase n=1 Tax=Streptomyces yerevanensis TaxID=66378 RepID=UPI0014706488|nr:tyrosine-type recombinase/integrase [Streptomyces yerevanensis]